MTVPQCTLVLTNFPEDSPSRSRLQRLQQPEETTLTSDPVRRLEISPPQNRQTLHQYDHDVVRELSLPPESAASGLRHYPTSNGSNTLHLQIETSRFPTTPYNNALAYSSARPRTPPVNLFTQHGLPSSLPPPPRTTFISQQSIPVPEQSLVSALDSYLRSSYSTMLSNKTDSVMNTPLEKLPQGGESSHVVKRAPSLMAAPLSSPLHRYPTVEIDSSAGLTLDEMFQPGLWEEPFLTSPQLDDSPEETPFIDTPLDGMNTSPMIGFEDDSFNLGDMPLFGADFSARKEEDGAVAGLDESLLHVLQMLSTPQETTATDLLDASKVESVTPALPPLDQAMYTMPSTPSFAPAALHNATTSNTLCLAPSTSSAATHLSHLAKPLPTGTRRNITPASLVPLDAPTQPRQYVTPSSTSRKVIPVAFVKGKKRGRSEVPDDDEEDIDITHLDPTTKEAIEAKRRQNTLAARRSRQRKLEHVRELEETVQHITQDRDTWMQRAYRAEEKLRVHGLEP